MITYDQFQQDFPEFGNQSIYTEAKFNFYLNFVTQMLTPAWGQPAAAGQPSTLYDIGCELFIAHNLALSAMSNQAASAGGIPGLNRGAISGESAGPLSTSYDTAGASQDGAGRYNLTTYGTDFYQMVLLLGTAPTQVGPSGCIPPNNGPAWIGLNPYPGYFG